MNATENKKRINYRKIVDNIITLIQKYEYEEDNIMHSKEEWINLLQGDLKND